MALVIVMTFSIAAPVAGAAYAEINNLNQPPWLTMIFSPFVHFGTLISPMPGFAADSVDRIRRGPRTAPVVLVEVDTS